MPCNNRTFYISTTAALSSIQTVDRSRHNHPRHRLPDTYLVVPGEPSDLPRILRTRRFADLQFSSQATRESGAKAESAFRIPELADAAVITIRVHPEYSRTLAYTHIHAYTRARARAPVERRTSFSQDAAPAPACRVLQPAGLLLPANSYYLFCTAYLLHDRVYTSSPIYFSPPSLVPHSPPVYISPSVALVSPPCFPSPRNRHVQACALRS